MMKNKFIISILILSTLLVPVNLTFAQNNPDFQTLFNQWNLARESGQALSEMLQLQLTSLADGNTATQSVLTTMDRVESNDEQVINARENLIENLSNISNNQIQELERLNTEMTEGRNEWRNVMRQLIEDCDGFVSYTAWAIGSNCYQLGERLNELTQNYINSSREFDTTIREVVDSIIADPNIDDTTRESLQDTVIPFIENEATRTTNLQSDFDAHNKTCINFTDINVDVCVANFTDAVFSLFIWVAGIVLWLVNILFDLVVTKTITDFTAFLGSLDVIDLGWKALRDIANLFFIFILLYLAGATILQVSSVDTKKTLVNIIIIALLINFSATFTKIAIDASNITASTFYSFLTPDGESQPDISVYFNNKIDILKTKPLNITIDNNSGVQSAALLALAKNLGILVLLVITIFTLLAATFLLLIRGVALIILIITSPLALLGYGFSPLREVYTMWLARLRCDLLFAPLFMFMLYLTLNIFGQLEANDPIDMIFSFFLLNGMMLGSILIAQKVGCQMSGQAFNFVKARSKQVLLGKGGVTGRYGRWAKSGAKATGGAIGRNTIGRLADKSIKGERVQKMLTSNYKIGRASSLANSYIGGKLATSGFGSGRGFAQTTENRQKRQTEIIGRLKDDQLKSQYLMNLSEKDRKTAYSNLSDYDKAKLETQARHGDKDGKGKNSDTSKALGALRKDLEPDQKNKVQEVMTRDLKKKVQLDNDGKPRDIPSQLAELKKIHDVDEKTGSDDAQLVYESLSDPDKVNLEKEANKNPDNTAKYSDIIKNAKEAHSKKSQDNVQKLRRAEQEFDKDVMELEKEAIIKELEEWADTKPDETFNPELLNKAKSTLQVKDIRGLNEKILTRSEFANDLEGQDVEDIFKKGNITAGGKQKLITNIKASGTDSAKAYITSMAMPGARQGNNTQTEQPTNINKSNASDLGTSDSDNNDDTYSETPNLTRPIQTPSPTIIIPTSFKQTFDPKRNQAQKQASALNRAVKQKSNEGTSQQDGYTEKI